MKANGTPHRLRWIARLCSTVLPSCVLLALPPGALATTPGAESTLSITVDTYRNKPDALPLTELFVASRTEAARTDTMVQRAVQGGSLMELDRAAVARLLKTPPNTMTLSLPTQERGTIELELYQSDIFAHDFAVSASSGADTKALHRGVHYRGIVKNERSSFAAISVFEDEVMGTFSTPDSGNWVIGKLRGRSTGARSSKHIVYAESAMTPEARKASSSQCMLGATNGDRRNFATFWGEAEKPGESPAGAPVTNALQTVKCATEWLEAEHDLFQNLGSLQATMNFMTGVFNNSATLYGNDGISLRLQQIHIWDTPDPYNGANANANLIDFQNGRSATFNGTIAQLLTLRFSGGVADGFDGICNIARKGSMATSGIDPSFSNVPTFSNTVQIVTHEAGHLLGSRHTHACVWNGNNTAIDGCAGFVEGTCANPGNPPAGTGTIMSYCGVTNVGQDFNLGFGPQPAAVIRNRVEAGNCLSNCDASSNGGGPLTPGVPMTNQSAPSNTGLAYTLVVPPGATNVVFTTSGGTGDADLFVGINGAPTTTSFACSSGSATNTETCTFASSGAGATYHVLLWSYASYAGVSITGSYTVSANAPQSYFNLTDVNIVDNATVQSTVLVANRSGNAPVNAVVDVGIDHTFIGDLKVDLVAPDGTAYNIHNRTGGNAVDIYRTVTIDLSSEPLNGLWALRVNDNGVGDIGKINQWRITF